MPTAIVGQQGMEISAYPGQTAGRGMSPVSDPLPRGPTWTVGNTVGSHVPGAEGAGLRARPVPHLVPTSLATGRPKGCRKPVVEPDASVRSTLLSRPR